MFERLLIPLDGSTLAATALTPAIKIANLHSEAILLVRAIPENTLVLLEPDGGVAYWPDRPIDKMRQDAERYLTQTALGWNLNNVTVDVQAEVGDPAQLIIEMAASENSDLIVMSTHGHSAIERWLMGSVTAKVMPHAPCPVLVVRSAEIPQHILLTLDCSRFAEHIIEPTIALARAFGAKITLLYAEEETLQHDKQLEHQIAQADTGLAERYKYDTYMESHRYLETIADRYAEIDVDIDFQIGRGRAARVIIETAQNLNCDLIAMSTHGRTGLARWRYGSVADRVLRHAKVGMFVSRPTNLFDD